MANADLANQYPAPKTNPSVGGSIAAGCGDDNLILVRKSTDGTIALAETVNDFQIKPIPSIFIGNCSQFGIYIPSLDFGSGPLTQVLIIPRFSIDINDIPYRLRVSDSAIGAGNIDYDDDYAIAFNSDFIAGSSALIVVPNPCANWLTIYTSASGVITGSSITINIARGWGGGLGLPNVGTPA